MITIGKKAFLVSVKTVRTNELFYFVHVSQRRAAWLYRYFSSRPALYRTSFIPTSVWGEVGGDLMSGFVVSVEYIRTRELDYYTFVSKERAEAFFDYFFAWPDFFRTSIVPAIIYGS